MKVAMACDHAAFELKQWLARELTGAGHAIEQEQS